MLVLVAVVAFVVGLCCVVFPAQLLAWNPRTRARNPDFDRARASQVIRVERGLGVGLLVLGVVALALH